MDPYERQNHMRRLVREGQVKAATAAKITKGIGDVAKFVLSAKAMIDLAIENIPQAALPWAGVCVALQVSRHLLPLYSSLAHHLDSRKSCKSNRI
jgi:hypothetical protein